MHIEDVDPAIGNRRSRGGLGFGIGRLQGSASLLPNPGNTESVSKQPQQPQQPQQPLAVNAESIAPLAVFSDTGTPNPAFTDIVANPVVAVPVVAVAIIPIPVIALAVLVIATKRHLGALPTVRIATVRGWGRRQS